MDRKITDEIYFRGQALDGRIVHGYPIGKINNDELRNGFTKVSTDMHIQESWNSSPVAIVERPQQLMFYDKNLTMVFEGDMIEVRSGIHYIQWQYIDQFVVDKNNFKMLEAIMCCEEFELIRSEK